METTKEFKSIFNKFEDLEEKLQRKAFDVYQNSCSDYNTDLMVNSEGEIKEYNYFGSCYHTGYEFVLKITQQDKQAWQDVWLDCMTPEQIEFCKEKDWQCIQETDSENPEDWKEYVVDFSDFSDTSDYISEKICQYEQELYNI
jgi:hypothetical protein